MKIFIDCEFNEFKGDLISMALVAEDGSQWYQVLPCENPLPWVKEHVIPILNKDPIDKKTFQSSLCEWLMQFKSIHIIADWPEDLQHFCESLITGAGTRINTPKLTMEVCRVNAPSNIPHNALHDAIGIRDFLMRGQNI